MWAEIGLEEELNVDEAIRALKKRKIRKLLLIINSFGGSVSSSFKIAYVLRKNLDHINTFIPHIAASGGTLIALTGDEIVMGDMSTITPIDVQMERDGKLYSVNAMIRSFSALNELFKDTSEEDAPYPWKAMANKLDPVEFQEWIDTANLMESHAKTILKMNNSFKDTAEKIISRLTEGFPTHTYCITTEEAKVIFGKYLHEESENAYRCIMEAARMWIKKYLNTESSNHIVRYILPKSPEEVRNEETSDSRGN